MPSIIDTVILCGHFGVPLRGHRDDNQSHPKDGEYSKIPGVGNFVELLNFAIGRGDKHLEDHYNTHAGNASYFSKTTQNEIINISGDVILDKMILSIKPQKNFCSR